jgi:hypothetical protein
MATVDNSLLPTGLFRVTIGDNSSEEKRLLSKNTVGVSFPSITSGELPTPFKNNQGVTPSDAITYDALTLTFAIDERMVVYEALHNWMLNNTLDDNLDVEDLSLEFITSHFNVSRTCRFHDIFPTSIGGVELNVQQDTTEYAFIAATFSYDRFIFDSA